MGTAQAGRGGADRREPTATKFGLTGDARIALHDSRKAAGISETFLSSVLVKR